MQFPKLKTPLDRRTLTPDQGRQLLAYDIIQRLVLALSGEPLAGVQRATLISDADANLHSLGLYIEKELGPDRFQDKPVDDGTVFQTEVLK